MCKIMAAAVRLDSDLDKSVIVERTQNIPATELCGEKSVWPKSKQFCTIHKHLDNIRMHHLHLFDALEKTVTHSGCQAPRTSLAAANIIRIAANKSVTETILHSIVDGTL